MATRRKDGDVSRPSGFTAENQKQVWKKEFSSLNPCSIKEQISSSLWRLAFSNFKAGTGRSTISGEVDFLNIPQDHLSALAGWGLLTLPRALEKCSEKVYAAIVPFEIGEKNTAGVPFSLDRALHLEGGSSLLLPS